MISELELNSIEEKLNTNEYISCKISDLKINNSKAWKNCFIRYFLVIVAGGIVATLFNSTDNEFFIFFTQIIAIWVAIKTFKEHSVSQEFKEKIQNLQEKVEKHNKKVYNYALKVMLQKKGITKVRQEITLSQWWYVSEEKFGVDNDEKAIIYYKFCFQASTSSASPSSFIKKVPYKDIIKYEIIDNSTTTQTSTSITSSNSGKALGGAILSDLLVNNATVGAIIGGSGARITETTYKTTVKNSFQIVIYLNSLDDSTITINTTDRDRLKGIVSILEYALRNQNKQ